MNVPNRKQLKANPAKGQAANARDIRHQSKIVFAGGIRQCAKHFPVQPAIARAPPFV
jgi:hypothetical protein